MQTRLRGGWYRKIGRPNLKKMVVKIQQDTSPTPKHTEITYLLLQNMIEYHVYA